MNVLTPNLQLMLFRDIPSMFEVWQLISVKSGPCEDFLLLLSQQYNNNLRYRDRNLKEITFLTKINQMYIIYPQSPFMTLWDPNLTGGGRYVLWTI